jgi:hypothetical protein
MMEITGIHWGVFLLNIVLIGAWPLSALIALLQLWRRQVPEVARAIWAVTILAIPFFGVIAYWLVQPGETPQGGGNKS